MSNGTKFSAIILAGGRSSRMGRPKCDLQFGAGTMLDYIVAAMTPVFDDLIVAVAEPRLYAWENDSARVVVDRVPHRGPVSALEHALREIEFDRAFVCACDVPFVNGDLARRLCDMLGQHDALIPQVEGKLQPLQAVYRRSCTKVFAAMRARDEDRLHEIVNFADVRIMADEEIRSLDPERLGFFNVNTPEDYQRALKLMRERNKM